jgi:hypothetical protein
VNFFALEESPCGQLISTKLKPIRGDTEDCGSFLSIAILHVDVQRILNLRNLSDLGDLRDRGCVVERKTWIPFVSETIPLFFAEPGRMITVSNVPSMFLNRFTVSRRVLSPMDVRIVIDAIPIITSAIIRRALTLLRIRVRLIERINGTILIRLPLR